MAVYGLISKRSFGPSRLERPPSGAGMREGIPRHKKVLGRTQKSDSGIWGSISSGYNGRVALLKGNSKDY